MDSNASQYTSNAQDEKSRQFEAVLPATMRPAMQNDRVQSCVTGQHFPLDTGGGIRVQYC